MIHSFLLKSLFLNGLHFESCADCHLLFSQVWEHEESQQAWEGQREGRGSEGGGGSLK